jgi:hypothetical protein
MMPALAHFRERQAELRERISWTPLRHPRRRQLQAELRQLVRDELNAELVPHPKAPQVATEPSTSADLFSADGQPPPTSSPAADDLYGGRTPYWIE